MAIKSDNYVIVQGWMCNELQLKGNELLVYALIYGFSQDGESTFAGGRKYIANTFNISLPTVDKALSELKNKQLIEMNKEKNNIVTWKVSFLPLGKFLSTPWKVSFSNNIINNKKEKKEILSKDKIRKNDNFLGSIKQEPKQNLYSQCICLIDDFVRTNKIPECTKIRELLIQHLDMAFENKSIKGRKQYAGILNKLKQIVDAGGKYQSIIQNSIEHGYATFYEGSNYSNKKRFQESGNKHVESFNEEDKKNLDEFKKQLEKEGKQIYF